MLKITPLSLDGITLLAGPVFSDSRGLFMETWRESQLSELGDDIQWQQENLSTSRHLGTVRGLHWQVPPMAQAKLVRVVVGKIYDVVVDIRRASKTFGHALGIELAAEANQALYIPIGFAHGFCTLVDNTVVTYKTSAYYDPASERALRWASPDLSITWPVPAHLAIVSHKDAKAQNWTELSREDLF